jgi:hypothetical protein
VPVSVGDAVLQHYCSTVRDALFAFSCSAASDCLTSERPTPLHGEHRVLAHHELLHRTAARSDKLAQNVAGIDASTRSPLANCTYGCAAVLASCAAL